MSHQDRGLGDLSMFDLFRLEVESQVGLLHKNLLDLEQDPESPKLLEALMRASHSLKGAARMVGVEPVVKIAHVMEDFFVSAQKKRVLVTTDHVDHLLKASDMVELIAKHDEKKQSEWLKENIQQVEELITSLSVITISSQEVIDATKNNNNVHPDNEIKSNIVNSEEMRESPSNYSQEDRTLRINAERMSKILGMTGELLVESRSVGKFTAALNLVKRRQDDLMNILERWREINEKTGSDGTDEYQRLAMQRLDECRRLLGSHLALLDDYDRRASNLSNKLYNEVAGSRMRPFADGVIGLKRMVRDLSRDLLKEASLDIKGTETSVDRDVLEKIKAPLNHLLRNAVDHGIELLEERAELNKPQAASIILSAKHGGGMLIITVEDDGAGIDVERLRQKLVEKGLVNMDMLPDLDESELLEFLFLPDFSTRNDVTEISGRGVGLDVVRDMVRELGGVVTVETKKNIGTKFTLQLPLTLSVISALLVEIANEPYAFPLVRVDRILRMSPDEIQSIEGRQYINSGLENIGLISGAQILGFDMPKVDHEEITIVVISDRLDRYGVVVDKFIGQRQLSVQALDGRLGKIPDVSAAALMEDGSPLFILDVDDLVRSINHIVSGGRLGNVYQEAEKRLKSSRKHILVVDDSLTIREVERDILESMGYAVDVAVDGMDAWNAIRVSHYDLVVTDIDMPRMDGIELVKSVKQDLHLKSIPMVIVSYKDRQEDRRRGLEAGADYYLAKGSFQDDTLIEAVADLIGEAAV